MGAMCTCCCSSSSESPETRTWCLMLSKGKMGGCFGFSWRLDRDMQIKLVRDDSGFQHGEFGGTVVCVRENYLRYK